MISLEPITEDMFDEIWASFLDDGDPYLSRDDWQVLFTGRPSAPGRVPGYALVDKERIGGILGTFHSTRSVRDRPVRFCNLHSWSVREAYRGRSLLLMRPVLRDLACTLTDFTPTEPVTVICKRLGFRPLDSSLRILPPLARSGQQPQQSGPDLVTDLDEIRGRLGVRELALLEDHSRDNFGHLLVVGKDQICYVIYTVVNRHLGRYAHIHYISDKDLFRRAHASIRAHILRKEQAHYIATDDRLTAEMNLPFSFRMPVRTPQLFRSITVEPSEIDNLYSEISLLSLAALPSVGPTLRHFGRRVINPRFWRASPGP